MPSIRRSADRRRRVLYQSHVAPHTPSTPATRRAAEELREARQPAKAFGSRVHRQLRGRWFSLVPVSRTALTIVIAAVVALTFSLTVLHHLAVTWPALAYREGIARPLRIDRLDSFAAWWTTTVLVLTAGAMRLIYVLRRHRRDDYRGHYQLWQLTLIVLVVASIHSTVGLVSWLGSFLDLIFGDRAVLSGANWLRIVLDVGGIVLAMRLVSEVYRCRPALVAMVAAATFFGLSEMAAWQLFAVDTMIRSTVVIAGPMLGSSCLLIAATIYLRALYRQVRNIPDAPTVGERWREWMAERREQGGDEELDIPEIEPPIQARQQPQRPQPAIASDTRPERAAPTRVAEEETSDVHSDDEEPIEPKKKPGFFSRFRRQRDESESESDRSDSVVDEAHDDEATGEEIPKRRWFGLRAAKKIDDDQQAESPAPKKRRFSLRLKPQSSETQPPEASTETTSQDSSDSAEDDGSKPKKKGWFGGLFGRKEAVDDEADSRDEADRSNSSPSQSSPASRPAQSRSSQSKSSGPLAARSAPQSARRDSGPLSAAARDTSQNESTDNGENIDPDDIDWESMSKAERRRVRKQLKRSGRAA